MAASTIDPVAGDQAPTRETGASEEQLYRRVIYRIVPLLFLGFIISYLDRVNIGFAKLQMAREFGLSDTSFAVGASVFFWGYMLFEIPSNLVLHRIGARVWIARIMISWGIVSMLMIFSRSETAFYALRFLLGVCEAGFVPGVMFYVNGWLPSTRQSGLYSLFLMALPVSLVLGAPLSGAILDMANGWLGISGWQWLFLIEGLPAILLGLVILARLDSRIAGARWLSEGEKQLLTARVAEEARDKAGDIWTLLRTGRVYLLLAIMILFNTGFYGLSFWLPSIVKAAGIKSDLDVGLLTAIPFVVAAFAMRLNALHSEKAGEKRLHGAAPAILAGLALPLSAYFSQNLAASLALIAVAAAGILSLMPIFWTLPGRILTGKAAAVGLAGINSFGSLSGILGAMIIGYAGPQLGIIILGVFLLMAGMLLYLATGLAPRTAATPGVRPLTLETTP
ncbi:MFS transporter [Aliidongia dinghuensis]|uniref:MFS transporter n=1 Tax=Aliidongia dinghuensis TaxID=1867774 RepID=A0A8J2YYQ9_9PROT|nr:MFS transporter [Aliidongia dinghuensis]GGF34418.1 MFS transporter [Aliidongia dinghuensis]